MSPVKQPKKYKCSECEQRFRTESAKQQHARAKHSHKAIQKTNIATGPPSSASAPSLTYRGVAYSTLSTAELDAIRRRLSSLCHSEQRLRKEGYIMPNDAEMQNGSHPGPRPDLPCPDTNPSAPKTAAIVLDCEMAGAYGGENELIQMTMIDFLSGEVLRSCLVNPSRPIADWREGITGISAVGMQKAVAENRVLHGWEAARAELWRFADKETILIGQSVHNDLKVLRTSHSRIIDSAIVTAEAVLGNNSKIRKRWSLQTLCQELLGIQIRKPAQAGDRAVHDALEDALATREVVLLCAREPDELKRWAGPARSAFFKGNKSKRTRHRTRISQPGRLPKTNFVDESEDEYDEPLRWEDVVDWELWPKSPPDSD
ncbi:hypothetical protein LX32DRAFT_645419 [Colletotrichum zoysiae]|uniref:C2H2-type domain-containing protein n=1 Tax=Colletotrichum zoysiae TaxID=1216348 RepID=A0AAD9LY97_9PEZI|nr:hypothetical protein LX32DRAFT_645419 [Colletotrichum zoysiae]